MKKLLTATVLAAALATSSSCWAALEYNYDSNSGIFSVTSEETMLLNDDANTLRIAFTKEYNFATVNTSNTNKQVQPTLNLRMFVEGKNRYEFADNVNYWQERNYTYQELLEQKAAEEIKKQKQTTEKEQSADVEENLEPKKRKRNPSTLIYLDVENKMLSPNSEPNPLPAENAKAAEQLPPVETSNSEAQAPENSSALPEQETLEQLPPDGSTNAEKQGSDDSASSVEQETARARKVEEVKALRAAFLKQVQTQNEDASDIIYTSKATASIPPGNIFWKKVIDSKQKNIPLFFEVKFWSGGANKRLWLQTEKLTELEQLLSYDLYQDQEHLRTVKR